MKRKLTSNFGEFQTRLTELGTQKVSFWKNTTFSLENHFRKLWRVCKLSSKANASEESVLGVSDFVLIATLPRSLGNNMSGQPALEWDILVVFLEKKVFLWPNFLPKLCTENKQDCQENFMQSHENSRKFKISNNHRFSKGLKQPIIWQSWFLAFWNFNYLGEKRRRRRSLREKERNFFQSQSLEGDETGVKWQRPEVENLSNSEIEALTQRMRFNFCWRIRPLRNDFLNKFKRFITTDGRKFWSKKEKFWRFRFQICGFGRIFTSHDL